MPPTHPIPLRHLSPPHPHPTPQDLERRTREEGDRRRADEARVEEEARKREEMRIAEIRDKQKMEEMRKLMEAAGQDTTLAFKVRERGAGFPLPAARRVTR